MLTSNGTDEGVLRAWLDREFRHWQRAFEARLLQEIDDLRHSHVNEQPASEPSQEFSQMLTDLLSFSRSAGALNDHSLRRLRESVAPKAGNGADALDRIFDQARQLPPGNQALHESWARCLMLLFYQHAAGQAASYPGSDALFPERLAWARQVLAEFAGGSALRPALEAYLAEPGVSPVIAAVIDHPAADVLRYHDSIPGHRIGLFTSASARWLVGAVERA